MREIREDFRVCESLQFQIHLKDDKFHTIGRL